MDSVPEPCFPPEKVCVGESEEIRCDVLVCGGGTAGALAAIAAARNGAETVIWESMDYLGGVGTGGALNGYYYGLPGGLQDEVDERVRECEKILYGRHSEHKPFTFYRFHPNAKMIVLEEMAKAAGVKIEYGKTVFSTETSVYDPENLPVSVSGAGVCPNEPVRKLDAVASASASGIVRCRAKVFIDSTGDADVAVFAGAKYTAGREPDGIQHIFSVPAVYLAAMEDREEKDGQTQVVNRYRNLMPVNLDAGYCNACDPWDVSRGRIAAVLGFDHKKYDEDGHLVFFSAVLGARASRQIQGDYKLGLGDQIRAARFPDLIAYSASHYDNHAQDYENESLPALLWTWALDAHNEPIGCEIPYRVMLPEGIENLIVACRALSLDFDANLQFRMQRDMQRIGEAAGIAAAEAVKSGVTPRAVNIRNVQDKLAETHALEEPENNYHSISWYPAGFHPENRLLDLKEDGYRPAENLLPSAENELRELEKNLESPDNGVKYCSALKLATVTRSEKSLALLEQCIRERCTEFPPKSWAFRSTSCWRIAIAVCGAAGYVPAREAVEAVLEDPECRKDPKALILAVRALKRIGNAHSAELTERLIQHEDIAHIQEFHRWGANDTVFRDDCRWKLDLAACETMWCLGREHPEILDKYRTDPRGYVREAVKRVESRLFRS